MCALCALCVSYASDMCISASTGDSSVRVANESENRLLIDLFATVYRPRTHTHTTHTQFILENSNRNKVHETSVYPTCDDDACECVRVLLMRAPEMSIKS